MAGLLLYGVERLVTGEPLVPQPSGGERVIVVTSDVIEERRLVLGRRLGRAPSEAELAQEMQAWLEEEVLSGEARLQGLDREDAVIRMRLARRMVEVLEMREAPPEVDDETLRAWHDAQPERWHRLAQVSVRQVFVPGRDQAARSHADDLLQRIEAGADPRELARQEAPPPGGPVLRGRTPDRLDELFGAGFVEGVESLQVGTWGVVPSHEGWHVVSVLERQPGGPLPWEQVRARVRAAWETEQVRIAARAALEQLHGQWTVLGWPP